MNIAGDFSSFGLDFEVKVLNCILGEKTHKYSKIYRRDDKFGKKILPHISPIHFSNPYAKSIVNFLKSYFKKYRKVPFYDTLREFVSLKVKDADKKELIFEYIKEVETIPVDNPDWIEENVMNFISTKNIKLEFAKFEDDIRKGNYAAIDELKNKIARAVVVASNEQQQAAVLAGDNSDLENARTVIIPTGVVDLDGAMNGGLALGELAVLVAGLKVGKTTFFSYIANNAALKGFKVLQIVYEDTVSQIKMKHRGKMSGFSLSDLYNKKNHTKLKKDNDKQLKKIRKNNGCLVIHKLDSTESTVDDIEKLIVDANEVGVYFNDTDTYEKIKYDLVLIDYLDCIKAEDSNRYSDEWKGEGKILRKIEKLASIEHGYGIAIWAATQGGRSSLNTDLVDASDVGGSIKKLQIAHFILSIAKSLEQRPKGRANVAILGSRIGRDGIQYKDCLFDNANMEISFGEEEFLSEKTVNDNDTVVINNITP